jgi:AmmeMemoRadiSam system protein A
VFVTLKLPSPGDGPENGVLRGCIGTMTPIDPLHQAVIRTARSAAFGDPRFPPVELEELQRVRISISVLTPMTPIRDASEIVVGRDGVQLERGAHRSVFLPQVPVEQGWSRERYLEQLARKAGLDRDAWRDARLSTFRTESFGE